MNNKATCLSRRNLFLLVFVIVPLVISTASCGLSTQDPSLEETALALAIQATIAAKDEEISAEDLQKTDVARSVQETVSASQPTAQPTAAPVEEQSQPPTATSELPTQEALPPTATTGSAPADANFEEWMKSANILIYEDIAGVFSTTRYIKEAMDRMGLMYVDVKDAMGRYKSQLLSGGPGGNGWDLIISAKESRGDVSGEFYVYLNDALNAGSSVIIEEWQLDSIGLGKISTILGRCGVEFQGDWAWDPLTAQILMQVDGANPIHHQPNEGVALTNPTGFWSSSDLGDFMRLSPGSSASPLWTARSNEKSNYLTAVSCLDNQLIIQTYSTHNYGKDRVIRMWENYIYNTLLARYQSLQ